MIIFSLPFLLFSQFVVSADPAQSDIFSSGIDSFDINPGTCANQTSTTAAFSMPTALNDKIAQTFIVGFNADSQSTADVSSFVTKNPYIGGIFFTGHPAKNGFNANYFTELQKLAKVPLLIGSDEEGGSVQRFAEDAGVGSFDSAGKMGKQSVASVNAVGSKVGSALNTLGVTVDLAPVLDTYKNISNSDNILSDTSASNSRSFGTSGGSSEDTQNIISKAGAFASGLNSAGVTPVYKHFPGIGQIAGNTDVGPLVLPKVSSLTNELRPYRALANQNDAAIMLSNAFEPDWNGGNKPTSVSSDAVNYLRSNIKFDGLIMTDALEAIGRPAYNSGGHSAIPLPTAVDTALSAGVDMPLFSYPGDTGIADIINTVTADKNASNNVDGALTKISNLKTASNAKSPTTPTTDTSGCCTNSASLLGDIRSFTGFNPDPEAVKIYNNQMKEKLVALAPLYQKAAAAEKVPEWQILAGVHNMEYGLSRSNPTTNLSFESMFQMSPSIISGGGGDPNAAMFKPGYRPTDDEFVQIAQIALKALKAKAKASTVNVDMSKELSPTDIAKVTAAYNVGEGSHYLTNPGELTNVAYAWAGYDTGHHKLPMSYEQGTIRLPGTVTTVGLMAAAGGGSTFAGTGPDCTGAGGGASAQTIVTTALKYAWDDVGKPGGHGFTSKDSFNCTGHATDATTCYEAAMKAAGFSDVTDCSYFVATVMRTSHLDDKFPGGSGAQLQWAKDHPSKYQVLPYTSDLHPGDILANSDHVYMYVGKQADGFTVVQASQGDHVPEINSNPFKNQNDGAGDFSIIRIIN